MGDHFTGSPFFTFLQGEAELVALKELGYDASALGNHDFDAPEGIPRLVDLWAKHSPGVKLLCGNVSDAATGKLLFEPHTIMEPVPGIRVGCCSVLGNQAFDVVPSHKTAAYTHRDFVECATESARVLRDAGCDVLVCLSHTGCKHGDVKLAELGLFDVIFSGHQHSFGPSDPPLPDVRSGEGMPIFTGPGGRLGLLSRGLWGGMGICGVTLTIDKQSRKIVGHESGVHVLNESVDTSSPSVSHVQTLVESWQSRYQALAAELVGELPSDIAPSGSSTAAEFAQFGQFELLATATRSGLLPLLVDPPPANSPTVLVLRNMGVLYSQ